MRKIPDSVPARSFDLVTLFDVLEHFEDDGAALAIYERLNSGGYVVLTVPAFRFLWSEHDDLAHHQRRYTKRELQDTLEKAGFRIVRLSYFNFFLFPVVAVARLAKKFLGINTGATDFFMPSAPINSLLASLFSAERYFLRYINFPFGVSIIAIAQKESQPFDHRQKN